MTTPETKRPPWRPKQEFVRPLVQARLDKDVAEKVFERLGEGRETQTQLLNAALREYLK